MKLIQVKEWLMIDTFLLSKFTFGSTFNFLLGQLSIPELPFHLHLCMFDFTDPLVEGVVRHLTARLQVAPNLGKNSIDNSSEKHKGHKEKDK